MAATTTDREADHVVCAFRNLPVKAGQKIPKGAMVNKDAAGFAVNATNTANEVFMGWAYESIDNTDGQDGDVNLQIRADGASTAIMVGATHADIGEEVFVVDNQTVSTTSANVSAGRIWQITDPDTVHVKA